MKKNLKDIASVQMGYSFRSRLEASSEGEVGVIQMKDLGEDGRVICNNLARIDMDGVKERHLVRKGDLVFRSRGLLTTSAILIDDPEVAVVAAPLLRVRVNDCSGILPEYLNWYIGESRAQAYFSRRADGTAQKMINVDTLGGLEVVIPDLKTQKLVVEMRDLFRQEKSLMDQILIKKEKYIAGLLMDLVKGGDR